MAGVRLRGAAVAYVALEDALIAGAILGAFAFTQIGVAPAGLAPAAALFLAIKAAFYWARLYDLRHLTDRGTFWLRLLSGVGPAAAAGWAYFSLVRREPVASATFLLAFAPAVLVGRLFYECLTRSARLRKRLLFLGVGEHARRTAREILDLDNRDYEVVGFLAEDEAGLSWRIGGRPVLGTYGDLGAVAERERIGYVVVAIEDRRRQLPLEALLTLRLRGVQVLEEARVHEEIAGKLPVEDLRPSWLIFSEGFSNTPLRNTTKRAFDVVVASLGLLLGAPVSLLVAIAIRLESRGPVLYRQQRVGRGGREFVLYKFRSMREDAEACGTPRWAQKDDPRVTRVGRFLRRTRLDEIPQMWNVLEGTMSFVGPRPERPFFVAELRRKIPFYDQRHALKPGITGWAQVRFRYGSGESDAVEKLRHDMYYVKHRSILFDLRILLETVRVVFERDKGR
ncbi:MAG: TIGR03013 family XrtA/PEP-CTERM system glycosyltransferase [Planctomycetota bacterium]